MCSRQKGWSASRPRREKQWRRSSRRYPEPLCAFPARLWNKAGLLRLSLCSGSLSWEIRASPCWSNVLTVARISVPCGKWHFYWCSQNQFSHCCSRGRITKLKKKTYSAFQLEFSGVGAFLGEDVFLVFSQKNGSWGSEGWQWRRKAVWQSKPAARDWPLQAWSSWNSAAWFALWISFECALCATGFPMWFWERARRELRWDLKAIWEPLGLLGRISILGWGEHTGRWSCQIWSWL